MTAAAQRGAAALTEFSFDDVRPAREFDFTDPKTTARVVTKTFDGLKVTVNATKAGNDTWATVSAEGATRDAAKEGFQPLDLPSRSAHLPRMRVAIGQA